MVERHGIIHSSQSTLLIFMRNSFSFRVHKQRILIILCVFAYSIVFNWTYESFVAPIYPFYGLSYNPLSAISILVSWTVVIIPSIWLPIKFNRPSLLLFYIQYFIIFIPSVFVLHHVSKPILHQDEIFKIVFAMFFSLSLMQCVYILPLLKTNRIKFRFFCMVFFISIAAFVGYILFKLGVNFRIVNFREIYEVRYQMSEIISSTGTRFGFYAQTWAAGFFLPVCYALGILSKRWSIKRWSMIAVVVLGFLLLFGVGGSKANLFALVNMTFVYFWLTKFKKYVAPSFILGLTFLLAIPIVMMPLPPQIFKWYVAVVHFRTFSIPALLIAQYYEFFKNHPLTYMSHVKGVNLLINYPYDDAYSLIIGNYFYGGPVNANAGFWAGDGLAGFGLDGIIVISIVCAFIFYILDSVSKPYGIRFVTVAITPAAVFLANAPLFTTLLSGGLGFLILALAFLPREGAFIVAFRTQK